MLEVNNTNFEEEVLKSDIPVLVDFFASWCGPCQQLSPIFEEVSKDFEGKVKFVKLSTEESPDLAGKYEVRSIPCLVMFKEGKEVNRLVGFKGKDELADEVNNML